MAVVWVSLAVLSGNSALVSANLLQGHLLGISRIVILVPETFIIGINRALIQIVLSKKLTLILLFHFISCREIIIIILISTFKMLLVWLSLIRPIQLLIKLQTINLFALSKRIIVRLQILRIKWTGFIQQLVFPLELLFVGQITHVELHVNALPFFRHIHHIDCLIVEVIIFFVFTLLFGIVVALRVLLAQPREV